MLRKHAKVYTSISLFLEKIIQLTNQCLILTCSSLFLFLYTLSLPEVFRASNSVTEQTIRLQVFRKLRGKRRKKKPTIFLDHDRIAIAAPQRRNIEGKEVGEPRTISSIVAWNEVNGRKRSRFSPPRFKDCVYTSMEQENETCLKLSVSIVRRKIWDTNIHFEIKFLPRYTLSIR